MKQATLRAIKRDHLHVVTYILNSGLRVAPSKFGYDGLPFLCWAAECGSLSAVKLLIQAGCPVDATDNSYLSPVLSATQRGDLEILECLVQAGADPTPAHATSWKNIPLYYAARKNHAEIIKDFWSTPFIELPQKGQIYGGSR